MPRAGQVKPPVVERLSDRIAIGALTSTYPPAVVDQVVAQAGRTEERQRLLPARVVVYLVLAMALYSGQAYEEVARLLAGGLGWARRWRQWWRVPSTVLPVIAALADGSYLSELVAARDHYHRRDPIRVRVVEYTLGTDRGRRAQPAPYRLVTSILDPTQAPAAELAALYHQRWEFETSLDELKTHQRGPGVVLRSKSPEMVVQEVWAMLLVHHAIRRLMHQAALEVDVDPDRLSFTRSLRIVRRQVTTAGQAAFPP
jgi:hypothetical protein